MTRTNPQDKVKKDLAEAWARFAAKISRIRHSAFSLRREMEDRRRRKVLAEAWARFIAKMSAIRGAVLALLREMEDRRRAKDIDEARQRLQKL